MLKRKKIIKPFGVGPGHTFNKPPMKKEKPPPESSFDAKRRIGQGQKAAREAGKTGGGGIN